MNNLPILKKLILAKAIAKVVLVIAIHKIATLFYELLLQQRIQNIRCNTLYS
ncbi:MAG: hypothetical protein RLZZ139_4021, partial [Cyanobacteriota bacterium]